MSPLHPPPLQSPFYFSMKIFWTQNGLFAIHYDPILRHVFDNALVDTEQHNDGQKNERDGLENIKEIGIHDDVEDGYVQAQEDNNPELDDVMEDNNMDGIENDDPNTSGNNMDGIQSNFNDDEYDACQDEDELLEEKNRITWMLLPFIFYQHMFMKTQNLIKY
jgi:hypothetical protein